MMTAVMVDKRVLVIRTGGLGDTLLLWPAICAMRRRFPESRIDLMGYPERLELLALPGGADAALDIEGSGLHTLYEVSSLPPAAVCARFGWYDVVVVFAAPGDYALAENLSACGVKEVHAFLPQPPSGEGIHAAEHVKRCLVEVGLAVAEAAPILPVTDREREEGRRRLRELGIGEERMVGIAPGSGSASKNWPAERFADLSFELSKLGLTPVFVEGPADKEAVGAVCEMLGDARPLVLRGDPPRVLKGTLARAALFVGNDAGPTHLAAALGVPTVAVFGPTDENVWSPCGPKVAVVRRAVACAPCSADDRHACEARICLEQIRVEDVVSACREFL